MDAAFWIAVFYVATYFGLDRYFRARGYRGPKSDHFDGKIFHNIGVNGRAERGSLPRVLHWLFTRPRNDWQWRENPKSARPAERVEGRELVVTFINHATVLIQTEGLNILTDPIWAWRTSPFPWFGPQRYRKPGIPIEHLPPIDLILLSHNHYDHMDLWTLREIQKRHTPRIMCGLGNSEYLSRHGVPGANDLDWWQSLEVTEHLTVRCVPAQHFSSRAISDRDRTLWCGFVLETPHGDIYFAGDSGYGPFIEGLQERYDSFRLGLLPIGAYVPWFIMAHVHMSPEEAYLLASELRVKTMIPIHYGTFRLADDRQDQPVEELIRAIERAHGNVSVRILENGQSVSVPH